jgi:hypothetical protein
MNLTEGTCLEINAAMTLLYIFPGGQAVTN